MRKPSSSRSAWPSALSARWAQASVRERRALSLGATVLALGLLWGLALAPALKKLERAERELPHWNQTLAGMQQMAAQAQALRAAAPARSLDPQAARRALTAAAEALGPGAELRWEGDTAELRLQAVGGDELAHWLARARTEAQWLPVAANLQRDATADAPRWSGSLRLAGPGPR